MKRILIVENDTQLSSLLQETFDSKSTTCYVSATVSESLDLLNTTSFDVAIVDRVLDDGDGLEVVESILDSELKTRIIALSKSASLPDRITGLETGCDDYMAKPFSLAELKLKVRKLLQLQSGDSTINNDFGPIQLNSPTGEIIYKSTRVHLRKREFEILEYLLRNQKQIVSRNSIMQQVWATQGLNPPSIVTLDVYIRRLRMALKVCPISIETVRGYGFVLKISN